LGEKFGKQVFQVSFDAQKKATIMRWDLWQSDHLFFYYSE